MPLERWDIERLYSPALAAGKMYTRLGAWLTAIDQFDGAMFGMNHSEAVAIDPQVRACCDRWSRQTSRMFPSIEEYNRGYPG